MAGGIDKGEGGENVKGKRGFVLLLEGDKNVTELGRNQNSGGELNKGNYNSRNRLKILNLDAKY